MDGVTDKCMGGHGEKCHLGLPGGLQEIFAQAILRKAGLALCGTVRLEAQLEIKEDADGSQGP